MKSRNTVLLLVVLVVLGVAAYFFSRKGNEKTTLDVEETAFAVKDTASVDKIFISSKAGWSHTLTRGNNGWKLDNKFEARQDLVNLLLETMHRMEVKHPGNKAARNQAIRDFATIGKKVEIYQKGKLTKSFYVGQTTDNDRGTYFIMEGSENPYVLHIPGFEGFLNTRFDVSEMNWRSVPVFRSTAESLKELKIEYVQNPAANLEIKKVGQAFVVAGIADVDQENLKAYLNNYRFVNGEFFLPNPQNRVSDSLNLQKRAAVITLTDTDPAKSRKIVLFPKPEDLGHFIALDEKNKEVISVQTFVFDRLLLKKDAFRKK